MPEWTDPMLATLTDEPFSDPDWLYERRLDGERYAGVLRILPLGQLHAAGRHG